jgi:hypothetical protein
MVLLLRASQLRELRLRRFDPVWSNTSHVERCHHPLRFSEITPSHAGDFQYRELLRAKRPLSKAFFQSPAASPSLPIS